MFSIGNVKIVNRVIAAPMAGISDRAFRMIARSFGCGLVFTEMVSDMGLVYSQTRTKHIADTSGEIRPIAVQIFGSNPESMARAALVVEDMGADMIDINMGCPTPKITKNGEGAALMLDIPRSRQITRHVVQAVRVPVTVKMRKGWDEDNINCVELAQAVQEEGASAIILHPRSRMQFFSSSADWDMIKAVKDVVRIPVIGSGDIGNAEDARRMIQQTGCDAVMIGRASLGNPFIFRETVELLGSGNMLAPPSRQERMAAALHHLDLIMQFKGEHVAVREMRKHLAWYIKGMPGAAQIRVLINQATTRDEMLGIIRSSLRER